MRRGVCVKCQGTELYQLPVKAAGAYQDLWLGGQGIFAERSSYFIVCGSCGFSERYATPDAMRKLAKYGRRLQSR
ncbi:hypothetical protein FB566_5028 [Stackebrandtia endophytica]|uniref:Uncharacterized protein n=1 Tax=Stackebrandtia endophytica TaxID=1496996 RepID=A0A543B3Q2_9ACTN|nr:hypothetical protein [Stackebrandtia endophytica]TQL79423.1 hypothetical protein FB566_5028 [Stackebrandtia endophytica]